MSEVDTGARELVERLFRGLAARDADAFAEFMAVDGVVEFPYRLPDLPPRVQGREAIREFLAAAWKDPVGEVHETFPRLYETVDPELFFVENEVDRTLPNAERERVPASINVVRVRNGEVTLFRDYLDTARLAGILDRA
ncbi:nuclear transport factor 2 family protein [Nocardia sp. CDC160]|uniref:nuclear transport factor 2 family protein n=1 Tax=Nocardia sp. CDC160 TaxID=3112166 RepID=UPI002DC05CE8|nr:nuclear transport factor 2 family protein [Nocardia sp. CDC160]MEC3918142.1 nuclear transport factor 2 family protein [Nocardia sp. CDC160]